MKLNIIVCCLIVLFAAVSCEEPNKAMSLQYFEKIYVPLGAGTFASMQDALEKKGIGNVMVSDTKYEYLYRESEDGGVKRKDLIVYSNPSYVPPGSAYRAITVREFYKAALEDNAATGIIVNPDVAGSTSYFMTKDEIQKALPKVKEYPSLPETILIAP